MSQCLGSCEQHWYLRARRAVRTRSDAFRCCENSQLTCLSGVEVLRWVSNQATHPSTPACSAVLSTILTRDHLAADSNSTCARKSYLYSIEAANMVRRRKLSHARARHQVFRGVSCAMIDIHVERQGGPVRILFCWICLCVRD